jgi:hypothetical protein
MDRHLRRKGIQANLAALATGSRGEVLATLPLHFSAGVRRVVNGVGYCFDELLAHGWRDVEPRSPLFIVAPARSGTTMLFHQLAGDPRFAAPTTGNTLIRSITVTKLVQRMARKQRGFILAARDQINEQMSALDDTHTLRIDRLEEDEGFFNDQFALVFVHLLFPTVHEKLAFADLDDRSARVQRVVMRKYRSFVRRFLYLAGPERTYLAKNVHSAGRMACLERTFPDARYIHIVRDPLVQLPSTLELVRAVAKGSHGQVRPPEDPYWRIMADVLLEHQRRLLAWERKIPASRWLTLRYDELIADPAASVRKVYSHFEIPVSEEREREIAAANERAGSFRKHRSYSLEPYGITPDYVREQLAEVYAAYGLA